MKAVVIAHGSLNDSSILKRECLSSDIVICADGGGEYAYKYGIKPDYLIGDFDSLDAEILEHFKSQGAAIEQYPREKDYTDTELCVYKALGLGCKKITIAAGTGDRLDHSLGNIGLLHIIKENGVQGCILSDKISIYLCSDYFEYRGNIGETLSIIPFGGDACGVSTEGLKYPLKNSTIKFGSPIGISNVITCENFSISVKKGEVLLIMQHNI